MGRTIGGKLGWTKEDYHQETKKYLTRKDHCANHPSHHVTIYKKGWDKELFSHMEDVTKYPVKWDKNSVKKAALKCKTREEFRMKFVGAYGYAKNPVKEK